MSHRQGVPAAPPQRSERPVSLPTRSKSKRLRTKRERDAAKFGPKVPSARFRRGPAAFPRRPQPPPWGGLASGSPLGPPKPVVITQNRLCHRGLFNREVKSLDVRRLLTPGPGGDCPPPALQIEEGEVGGVPAEALKELAASLASLLGSFGAFSGRELASERRRSLSAALRKHRRGPPDPRVFLAHRTPARPPDQETPRVPRQEVRPGPPGRAVILGGREAGDPPAGTPSPLHAVDTPPPPPHAPSPIFGAPRERETPFSWSSAEEDATPGGLTRTWAGPEGLLPGPPPFWRSPQPPQEREDEGWTPIAPPAFSPAPPPWGHPQSRDTRGPPRLPQTPKIWRTENPWDPPDPPRPPRDAPRLPWDSPGSLRTPPRLLWELPDPARAPPSPPRPSRDPQIWCSEPRRGPLDSPRPLWDLGPWSPDPPRATPDHRTPQLWNAELPRALLDAPRPLWDPPRPHWEPPDAPTPLWDTPDPPRGPLDPPRSPWTPRLWSPEPPGAPQNPEPSRCCCHRLCHDALRRRTVRHDPPYRDPHYHDPFPHAPARHGALRCRDAPGRCHPAPKRSRPDRARVWGGTWGCPGDSPPSPLLPSRCRCPCRGGCWGGP